MIRNLIRKWLGLTPFSNGEIVIGGQCVPTSVEQAEPIMEQATNLYFCKADNGWVITMRFPYNDAKSSRKENIVHVVPQGEDMVQHITALLVAGKLNS